ncbi:MAG: acetate/propionate family kinase [Nitrospira sp.]|nr:acetate/propionate family kinase [Nitrospira sp.]
MNILVLNCGSSSIKYQLLDTGSVQPLAKGVVERVTESEFKAALTTITAGFQNAKIDAVGHRVVHGGGLFHDAREIDAEVINAIRACIPLAPLHNPANLAGIEAALALWPDLPQIAVFDTAFHARLPEKAQTYAIDVDTAQEMGIRRYGFHGTSHAYVVETVAKHLARPRNELRLITCHLGNGASVCAVEFGHSVDTSMGMTPLEGLVMGSRSGDIDPGVVLNLSRKLGIDETETLLNRRSGLVGLSGISKDLRDIEKQAAAGHERARLAISVFAHRVRKYIGAYAALMGGVDAVVLTGGIGENSAQMRRRILQRFEFLGLALDEDRNIDARVSHEQTVADISVAHSRVRALVVACNEERYIAREAERIIRGKRKVKTPGPIPIAVSARHIHLSAADLAVLFGSDYQLTVFKAISQPGQFAANEKVSLIGPRGRIDNVRILGPLRAKTQVEISRSDEFKLGVDAPIRDSGKVDGSAPIILEGPAGRLSLSEGLICARRHIHMTPEDAEAYGVKDHDEVEVAIEGGPRDLVFGDVLVRVKDSYVLEMHIDTDEANAAELDGGMAGDLIYETTRPGTSAAIREKH